LVARERGQEFIDAPVIELYDHVYAPLAGIIERSRTLRDFPGRTSADLYLWVIEHERRLHA
jgi:hypothetical protein